MAEETTTANDALADGLSYVQDAWRDLWGVQALLALGVALMVVAVMGRDLPDPLQVFAVGAAVSLVAVAPLYGALYRVEIGGPAERTLGPLGLQLGLAEGRLWAIWLARLVGITGAFLAATTVSALVFILLRPLGVVSLGPLGAWSLPFLIAFAVWSAAAALAVYTLARLSLASAASVDAGRLVIADTWPRTAGRAISLTAIWIAARLPSLALLVLFVLIDRLVNGRIQFRPWPILEAAAWGVLVGVVLAFVQAPLAVGALSSIYRRLGRPARPSAAAASTVFEALKDAAPPRAPISHDRPADPTERFRQILGEGWRERTSEP